MPALLAAVVALSAWSSAAGSAFELDILHINDHHGHLEPNRLELDLGGQQILVESGGFARVAAMMKSLSARLDHVLKLHAGDALTGTIYYSVFRGEADAALMNEVCFDAFVAGNHEFDDGDAGLAAFIGHLNAAAVPCRTAVLAANVVPAEGTPLAPAAAPPLLEPHLVVERGGERIGIIGIDIADKTTRSSSPLPGTRFLDERESAQREIDILTASGVDKIVLLTHVQYRRDLQLAAGLRGVDVIVGGDSHTLLGEDFDRLGLTVGGPYPTVVDNADGDPVCIVQAWEYANVVGHLRVRFDAAGRVVGCEGTPHLLLGDSFQRRVEGGEPVELRGAEQQAVLAAIEALPVTTVVAPDADTVRRLSAFADRIAERKHQSIGVAEQVLCQERVPGQGRSALCPCVRTAVGGGDVQQIVADAFLARSFEADVAVQNSGGVRIDLDQGPLTVDHAYTLLPFSNTLVNLTMSGAEIRSVLEEAISHVLDEAGSSGAWPYAAGLRWTVDLSAARGQRLSGIEVRSRDGGQWAPLRPERSYTVVTNSFLAAGRDGYATFAAVAADGRMTDTGIEYAQAFIDYMHKDVDGPLMPPAPGERSHRRILGQAERVGGLLACAAPG